MKGEIIAGWSATVFVAVLVIIAALSIPVAGSVNIDNSRAAYEIGRSDQPALQSQPQNGTEITFNNQSSDGSVVTIDSVTLSQPGYVGLLLESYGDNYARPSQATIAISKRLSAGNHQNVKVIVSNSPPGNPPGLNISTLNTSQTLSAVVYEDNNSNQRMDYVRSFGGTDTIGTSNGEAVSDSAYVEIPSTPQPTASVSVDAQQLTNNTLVVSQARLPDGGFIVAHNASLRNGGDPLNTAIGSSAYLSPGQHSNINIQIPEDTLDESQIVTFRAARDTDSNQEYSFVSSGGFDDVAYTNQDGSTAISSSARIRIQPNRGGQSQQSSGETRAGSGDSASTTQGGTRENDTQPRETNQGAQTNSGANGSRGGSGATSSTTRIADSGAGAEGDSAANRSGSQGPRENRTDPAGSTNETADAIQVNKSQDRSSTGTVSPTPGSSDTGSNSFLSSLIPGMIAGIVVIIGALGYFALKSQ